MGIMNEIKEEQQKKPEKKFIGGWLMMALMNTIVSPETAEAFANWLRRLVGFCKEDYDNFVNSTNQKFADIFEIIDEKFSALTRQIADLRSDHSKEIKVVDAKIDGVGKELQNRLQKLEEALQKEDSFATALSTAYNNRLKTNIQQTDIQTTALFLNNLPEEEIIEIICLGSASFWQVRCNEKDIETITNWQQPINLESVKKYFRRKYIYKQVKEQIVGQLGNQPNGFFNNLYDSIQVIENENPALDYNGIVNLVVPMFIQKYEHLATSEETAIAEMPTIQEEITEPFDNGKPAKRKSKK